MKRSTHSIKTITVCSIFTAIISIISAFPAGFELFGVPATLQTFAMALTGFVLGAKKGAFCCVIYLLMGFIGIPVYNKFMAGPAILFGPAGGFLFGFPIFCFLSGFGMKVSRQIKAALLKSLTCICFSLIGLFFCHVMGIRQFSIVYGSSLMQSFLLISLPYLAKDVISVILAYLTARTIRKALLKTGMEI